MTADKSPRKLECERRALLKQLGGFTCNGSECIYSTEGRAHLEAVTERKARAARVAAASRIGPPDRKT